MKYFAGLEIKNPNIPRKTLLDEFVEYAAKLDLEEDFFSFQEIQFSGEKYIAVEVNADIKIEFPLKQIQLDF
jgi:hypothetical protein